MMPEEKLPNPTDLKRSQGWDILLNKERTGEDFSKGGVDFI